MSIKKDPNQAKIYQDLIKIMSVTLEILWLVSDRIVDFRFFVKFHKSGPAIILKSLNYHGACKLSIKKAPNQAKIYQDLIKVMSVTLERLRLVCDRIIDFRFFVKFHR